MYKIVLIIVMKSILFSQDKMILKGGEEIILLDRTNFIDYDDSYSFIEYKSKYYAKNKIALLILNNSEIIIRSGIPISIYNSLSLEKKAAADNKRLQDSLLKLERQSTKEQEQQFLLRQQGQDQLKQKVREINKQRKEG